MGGLLLVLWQHLFTVLQWEDATWIGRLNVGALGVGFFLAASGYLAAHSVRTPMAWIGARLRRLAPSYWIVTTASLVAAWLTQYKPVTARLAVAQFLGIAGITHPKELVNVATWFISLLLVCYLLAFALKLTRSGFWASMMVAAVILIDAPVLHTSLPLNHVFTFVAAFSLGLRSRSDAPTVALACLLAYVTVIGIKGNLGALYSILSISALLGGLAIGFVDPFSHWISDLSYQVYLVHGPIVLAVASIAHGSWKAVIGVGVPISFLGAAAVRTTANSIERIVATRYYKWRVDRSPLSA